MYDGVCYTNGSYFLNGPLSTTDLICGHSDAGGGQWLYPDGSICTNTSSPIQCTPDMGSNTFIVFKYKYKYFVCLQIQIQIQILLMLSYFK